MQVPKISQVPIQQTMYVNGLMHQTWVRFFERLSNLRNDADLIDIIELNQVANEMPSQAIQGQFGFDLEAQQQSFDLFAQETLISLQNINNSISNIEASISGMQETLNRVQSDILNLQSRTSASEQNILNLDNRISGAETSITNLNTLYASLNARVTALEKK